MNKFLEEKKMKDKFIGLLRETKREGIENLIDFLEKTDFFTAPASTKFHNSFEGGLLAHSLNVYEALESLVKGKWPEDTIRIVALLHDICKINLYKVDYRNKKDATQQEKDMGEMISHSYDISDRKFIEPIVEYIQK